PSSRARPPARPGGSVPTGPGPEGPPHGLEYLAHPSHGPYFKGARARSLSLFCPFLPRRPGPPRGRGRRSRPPWPLPREGLAREPDGLPVPPRKEPEGRARHVRQLRGALSHRAPRPEAYSSPTPQHCELSHKLAGRASSRRHDTPRIARKNGPKGH